jgi:hypothetical protein
MKNAKERAMDRWNGIRSTRDNDDVQLGAAVEAYVRHQLSMHKMAPAIEKLARYSAERYLTGWGNRTLEEIGRDRASNARSTRI